jgi:NADH-quinone oxidoreductase subunit F
MGKIVSRHFGMPEMALLSNYEKDGGYSPLDQARRMNPSGLIDLVEASGLRGRGGAGFPTGKKWSFVPKNSAKPVYLCVNADEGEPGTFKDREILRWDPHLLIEGSLIAAHAIGSASVYIYVRGEFVAEMEILRQAIGEASRAGHLREVTVTVHSGAGAYICGEETSLINSLEGKRGYPRLKPPFPALEGLFGSPTIVNNVETLANLPGIVRNGAAWYRSFGTEKSPGTRLFCVSGQVRRPGVYELPMNVSLQELISEHAGGLRPGRRLKAVIPGGVSCPVLRAEECDVTMDFESLASRGSAAGSGGVIVMDDSTCMVKMLRVITEFYAHESCGQCTPCREGVPWLAKIVRGIDEGRGTSDDLDLLTHITGNMKGRTVCVFADAAAAPVESFLKKFREEFERHITGRGCAQSEGYASF